MQVELIGTTSRLQDASGNTQPVVGHALLTFSTDIKAQEGLFYTASIPCLPIFVPNEEGSWRLQRIIEVQVQNDKLAIATGRNSGRITRPIKPKEKNTLLPNTKTVFQRS